MDKNATPHYTTPTAIGAAAPPPPAQKTIVRRNTAMAASICDPSDGVAALAAPIAKATTRNEVDKVSHSISPLAFTAAAARSSKLPCVLHGGDTTIESHRVGSVRRPSRR